MKTIRPSMLRCFEQGKTLAQEFGAGLSVETRICLEWQRKDKKNAEVYRDSYGRKVIMKALLNKPRKVFEVVTAGSVIGRFRFKYEADSFAAGYTMYRHRPIRSAVNKLRGFRNFCATHTVADAA